MTETTANQTVKRRHAGKVAGASLGSTVSILLGYGLTASGVHIPAEVLSAGVSLVTAAATWAGNYFD